MLVTPILCHSVKTDWIRLYPDGSLVLMAGYASDGPSGPSVDTKSFMRGSFAHDALYQLIMEGYLPLHPCKGLADEFLRSQCLVDDMFKPRAWWVYQAVDKFGGPNCVPGNGRETLIAPSERIIMSGI